MYVYVPRALIYRIQKRVSSPLELELQMVVNFLVGTGN